MAAGMKAVRQRIRSIESTRQVTRAMELAAAARLRGSRERAENVLPYFQALAQTMEAVCRGSRDIVSPYLYFGPGPENPGSCCLVVIGGDRGLAGAYNANLFKAVEKELQKAGEKACAILPVGRKAAEYCRRRGIHAVTEEFSLAGALDAGDWSRMAGLLCRGFVRGEFARAVLCYTRFYSVLSHCPKIESLLPLGMREDTTEKTETGTEREESEGSFCRPILWEPEGAAVLDAIVPEYVAGRIYGALCQSIASETAARRTAMDAASKNAGEMLDKLYLSYNRARQAGITQEIAEIAGGERI